MFNSPQRLAVIENISIYIIHAILLKWNNSHSQIILMCYNIIIRNKNKKIVSYCCKITYI